MLKRSLLASAVAVVLAGAALPAAAVISADLGAITDTISVTSDTGAYDAWASTCPNVSSGGSCDAGNLPGSDSTLFFWGSQGNAGNSNIQITWTGAQPTETIKSVRITSTGTTPLGAPAGPLPFDVATVPGFEASFDGSDRDATDPTAGTFAQGQGLFLAYGRTVFDPDGAGQSADWVTTQRAVLPFSVEFEIGVDGPGGAAATTEVINGAPTDLYSPYPGLGLSQAQQFPVDAVITLPGGDQGVLNPGQTLDIELFLQGDSTDVPGNVPVGYMDDIQIQLNPGPRLEVTPADATVTVGSTRAGTVTAAGDRAILTAENIGDEVPGNATLNGRFNAFAGNPSVDPVLQATDGTAALAFDLASGATAQRSYELDATGVAFSASDAGSTGQTFSATQQVVVTDSNDFGAPQTRTVQGTVVGPILGVQDNGSVLDYGSEIAFDSVDFASGTFSDKTLSLANLFGQDIPGLTDLTLDSLRIDGDGFEIVNAAAFVGLDPVAAGGILPDLQLRFTPDAVNPGDPAVDYSARLFFGTDMNRALGDTAESIFFDLSGTAENTAATGPSLGVTGDIAFDTQVRAGTVSDSITATNDGADGSTLAGVVFGDLTGTNVDRLATDDDPAGIAAPPGVDLDRDGAGVSETATRTYTPVLTLADQGSTGVAIDATQTITADADDSPQVRSITTTNGATIVGPILGAELVADVGVIADANAPAATLPYGSQIDLGTVDVGDSCFDSPTECPAAILSLGNLFGADLDALTDLTVRNAALDETYGGRFSLLGTDANGDCVLSSANPYASQSVWVATGGFGMDDLCIYFDPGSYPGGGTPSGANERTVVFDTTLRFFTDMNYDFGTIASGNETYFDILVTAVYEVTPSAPTPAPLALIGAGLAGLGGLRARRRRGADGNKRTA